MRKGRWVLREYELKYLIFVFCLVGGLQLCPASFLILSLALFLKFALPNGLAFVLLKHFYMAVLLSKSMLYST